MESTITDWLQAGAGLVTMVAAIAALIIASKAPRLAAKFAEDYRRQNSAEDQRQQLQMQIMAALMKCRSEILHPDARAAINLADVAFSTNQDVLSARRLFLEAAQAEPYNPTRIVERYHMRSLRPWCEPLAIAKN